MKRASLMYAASMLPRYRVKSPVKSGATRTACSANSATTTSRPTGSGDLGADRMRRVWVARLDRDRHDLHRVAKCDRSETLGDRFRLVALLPMFRAAERCENARVVGERDRSLVIEAERPERLDRVENELLGLRELAALHRPDAGRLGQQRATPRVPGALDDCLDAFDEGLILDAPARRGQYPERSEESLIDEALGITGAPYGVIARLAFPHPVVRGHEVARRDVGGVRLAVDQL